MPVTTSDHGASERTPAGTLKRAIFVRFLQLLLYQIAVGAILFGCAGSWRWPAAWAYLGLTTLLLVGNAVYVLPRNPEIVAERGRLHRGTRRFDRIVLPFYTVAGLLVFVISGLDVRFGSTMLSPAWQVLGGVLVAAGMVPAAGAMAANRNLEPTVRIQQERGHQVATTGPYRHIRHPMYAGIIVQTLGVALLLGSARALLAVAAVVALLVVRTTFEDRMLSAELPGYADYASRTRYRLIPGVW